MTTQVFYIPMQATINVMMREANIDLAVSQAEGELEQVFELLDDLCRVDTQHRGELDKETIIDLLQVGWGKMDLERHSIKEAKDAN